MRCPSLWKWRTFLMTVAAKFVSARMCTVLIPIKAQFSLAEQQCFISVACYRFNTCTWVTTCILYSYLLCFHCILFRGTGTVSTGRMFILFIYYLCPYLLIFWLWIDYLKKQNMMMESFKHWTIFIKLNVSGKTEMM